jgi:hypothetical protein
MMFKSGDIVRQPATGRFYRLLEVRTVNPYGDRPDTARAIRLKPIPAGSSIDDPAEQFLLSEVGRPVCIHLRLGKYVAVPRAEER